MAKATLQVKGIDELVGKLKRNAKLDDVKEVVKLNGSEMHTNAQRKAPVAKKGGGNLQRNVRVYIEDNDFTARVKSEADYAAYQEYGTRFQPGTPHIRPAYYEQKERFKRDMKRLMK